MVGAVLVLGDLAALARRTVVGDQDRRPWQRYGDRDDGQRQAAEAEERKAIAGIETDVRIKSLQAQVDQLQAQLSEIRDGKDALDTRLLAERVSSLEQRVYAGDPPAPKATATPTSTPTPRPRPKLELKLPPPER